MNDFRLLSFRCRPFQYASLFFIVGVGVDSDDENELGVLEFIHCLVETLDKVRLRPAASPAGETSAECHVPYVLRRHPAVQSSLKRGHVFAISSLFLAVTLLRA